MEVNIPRDFYDSARDSLGRHVRICIKRLLRFDVKVDKPENKVVVLSPYRLYILAAKTPYRLEQSISFLDIQSIESRSVNEVIIAIEGKRLVFHTLEGEEFPIDHIITHINSSLKKSFVTSPRSSIWPKHDVRPSDRLKPLYAEADDIEKKGPSPCGGFSAAYACMCDYYGNNFMADVEWDVDTIYLSQDSKELRLGDFDHLSPRDLVPIVGALQHNTWFTSFSATNVKLTAEITNELLKVLKFNKSLEELHLSGTGLKADFVNKFSQVLLSNPTLPLTTLDLSNNFVEDRGLSHIYGPLGKMTRGLVTLNLSKTGITCKGANKLAESLTNNKAMTNSLKHLDLSDNNLKGEELSNLHTFLSKSVYLRTLNLSGTECALENLFGALVRGCASQLTHLDVSSCVYTHKKTKEISVPPAWKTYFQVSSSLQTINLSDCRLPTDAIKSVLLGLASNDQLSKVFLNLSSNELGGAGAQLIETIMPGLKCVQSLDISNNNFDISLGQLLNGVAHNSHLQEIALGRNFAKSKHLIQILDSITMLLNGDNNKCCLKSLSLADSKLKLDTLQIINALGSNDTLTEIDVSGNQMGDIGARMLAKALQINTKLQTVYWDRNGTSAQGFQDIATALEKNYTLKKMPSPVNDVTAALAKNPEKTEQALRRIEMSLQRNHSSKKVSCEQAYRLQQGFFIGMISQEVAGQIVNIQDTIKTLEMGKVDEQTKKDIERARALIKDADLSKQLLPKLQSVGVRAQEDKKTLDQKLKTIAQDLQGVTEEQLKETTSAMVDATVRQCPTILAEENVKTDMENICSQKSTMPKDFVLSLLRNELETDISNKVGEVHIAVASHLSDRLIDAVEQELEASKKALRSHLSAQQLKEAEMNAEEEQDRVSTLEQSKSATDITSKRKSRLNRKTRPPSVIDKNDVLEAMQMNQMRRVKQQAPLPPGSPVHKKHEPVEDCPVIEEVIMVEDGVVSLKDMTLDSSSDYTQNTDGNGNLTPSPIHPSPASQYVDTLDNDSDAETSSNITIENNTMDMKLESIQEQPAEPSPRKQSSSKTPTSPVKTVAPLDDLPDLQSTAPKLSHVTKSRPTRNKTRAMTRPTINHETVVESEDLSSGVDKFFESPPPPSMSRENSVDSVTSNNSSTNSSKMESPKKSKSEKSKGGFGGITSFFKKKDKDKESPTHKSRKSSSKETTPSPDPERKLSSDNSLRETPSPETSRKSVDKDNVSQSSLGSLGGRSDEELDVAEKEEEPKEPKKKIGVPMFGLPGMKGGPGGSALLKEMKLKNQRKTEVPKDEDKDKDKDKEETIPKKEPVNKPSPVPARRSHIPSSSPILAKKDPTNKPIPVPRLKPVSMYSPTPTRASEISGEKPEKKDESPNGPAAPVPKPRPPPPTSKKPAPNIAPKPTKPMKPQVAVRSPSNKPSVLPPKPTASRITAFLKRFQDPADSGDATKGGGDVKKRTSVLDRVSMLDNNNKHDATQSELKAKTSSLPRSTENIAEEVTEKTPTRSASLGSPASRPKRPSSMGDVLEKSKGSKIEEKETKEEDENKEEKKEEKTEEKKEEKEDEKQQEVGKDTEEKDNKDNENNNEDAENKPLYPPKEDENGFVYV